jgi:transcription initiation factor TFIIE subunit alpha
VQKQISPIQQYGFPVTSARLKIHESDRRASGSNYKLVRVHIIIVKKNKEDKATLAYLEKLVGQPGLDMIKRLSKNELTDQQIAEETGSDLNTVRRTLFTLYEHRLAFYTLKRDKKTGWMLYRWLVDFEDIQRRLADDAQKLLSKLETWLDGEMNTAYYTCDNDCGRYTFDMASGYTCGYKFVCPVCKQSLHYDDTSKLTDAMQGKISELRTDVQAIFYPENSSIFDLVQTEEE